MMRSRTSLLLCGLSLAIVLPVGGGAADDAPTYTNADLEQFGPPSDARPADVDEQASWRFVTEFLEREQAKLDAERAVELARSEMAIEQAKPVRPRYRLAYPYYRYGHYGVDRPWRPYGIGVPPAHARPVAQPQPKKKPSGADAFPSNRRRAEREAGR